MAKSQDTTIRELVKEFDSLKASDTTHQLEDQARLMVRGLNSLKAKCSSKIYYRPTSGSHPKILEQLKLRTEHLKRLESGLLPSLRHRITALLLSLDPSDLRKDPTGKMKIILGILSELEQTLDQIHTSMDTIIPVPTVKPSDVTDDNHLKTLKAFRTSRLGMNADDLFKLVAELLDECVNSIENLEQPSNTESRRRAHLLSKTSIFWDSIDRMIQWFGRSEFNLLQDSWQSEVALVEDALDELLDMMNPVKPKEEEDDDQSDATSSSSEDGFSEYDPIIWSEEVIQLAKVTIPIVKLSRLFLNKLSNTTVTKVQFGLATSEMSSSELENVVSLTSSISQCIDEIGNGLYNGENVLAREMLVEWGGHLGKCFKHILELLDLHLIPLIPQDDQSVDPKKWFSEWNKQFALALENYMSMAQVSPQRDS